MQYLEATDWHVTICLVEQACPLLACFVNIGDPDMVWINIRSILQRFSEKLSN